VASYESNLQRAQKQLRLLHAVAIVAKNFQVFHGDTATKTLNKLVFISPLFQLAIQVTGLGIHSVDAVNSLFVHVAIEKN
jgi:hypothetical protein